MTHDDKELFFKINMLENYMRNVQQQIEAVENEMTELTLLKQGIEELKDSSGKEVFSSVGKNIFIKTKIVSEDLLVGIGEKNLVKKSVPQAAKMIEFQIKKLESILGDLAMERDNLNKEAEKLLITINPN
jgi:prefoldin alpha subunit